MFKFDFVGDVNSSNGESNAKEAEGKSEESNSCYDSQEVEINNGLFDDFELYKLNSTTLRVGSKTLNIIVPAFLLKSISLNNEKLKNIAKAEQSHSDLIPGVYEGGAKIWECTHDLLEYMDKYIDPSMFKNKRVLDLGCGAGLLGIYAYKCGAIVEFQDYNIDVLENITIPNVLLNAPQMVGCTEFALKELTSTFRFYCGDWSKYANLTEKSEQFDVILTSETLYNPSNQRKLLNTMHAKLKTTGVVFIAAKSYYFGVGGSLRQFENKILEDGRFLSESVWSSTNGISREILELKRKLND